MAENRLDIVADCVGAYLLAAVWPAEFSLLM